jgi:hypothetical protein
MGDYIYAISHGGITVTSLDSLEETDSHQFEYLVSNNANYSSEDDVTEEDKNED